MVPRPVTVIRNSLKVFKRHPSRGGDVINAIIKAVIKSRGSGIINTIIEAVIKSKGVL